LEDAAVMTRADEGHDRRTQALRRVLEEADLEPDGEHPCTYLPGRRARQVLVNPQIFTPGLYHAFMDLNFRRLGFFVYRAACRACTECRMLRVLVDEFAPTRAQRRCLARNGDLRISVGRPEATDEKRALYRRYLESRHDGTMSGSADEMASFLYDAPSFTVEVTYRAGDRLVAVGIADLEPRALSAVYCYFDPAEARRSPGVFNVLTLLEECRARALPYLYLGYFVAGSRKMAYKSGFRPHEVLRPDGRWERQER
jgi:arginyl-tRNA--protein-N-Asp/Glu arginylyltransferase